MEKDGHIYVAGAAGFLGSAIVRKLRDQGFSRVIGIVEDEPDLTDGAQVEAFFSRRTLEYVFLAAGKSGGISANQRYPAELMRDNLLAACNVIHAAYRHGVKKLLYLASSCSYSKECAQPMRPEFLLSGPLEPSSESYALAKIAGIKLSQAYRRQYGALFVSAIAANPFGPGDDFSAEDSHVVAALIRKMHEAKTAGARTVPVWGSGRPRREFIFVDDLADACVFAMNGYDDDEPINLGMGSDLSVRELAELVRDVVGFRGEFQFDPSRPDGMFSKLLDSSRLERMGWKPQTSLRAALEKTYDWFLQSEKESAKRGVRSFL